MTEPTLNLPPEPNLEPKKKRGPLVAAGVVALALIGGGAYAWNQLGGGGAQPADVLPADTIAYARVDIDPSASQKINAVRLIRRVPALADELGIKSDKDDLRKLIFSDLVKQCDGANYESDVEPWLGDRAGIGFVKSLNKPVVVIEATDEGKAKTSVAKLAQCGGESTTGIAFSHGYLVAGPDQATADAAVKSAEENSLADAKRFSADEDTLGDRGIASAWVDVAEARELPELKNELGTVPGVSDLDTLESVTLALRAHSDAIELTGFAKTTKAAKSKTIDLGALPKDSALAFGFDFGGTLENFKAIKDGIETELGMPESEIAQFVDGATGLKYPEDLETLISGGMRLSIGSTGLNDIVAMGSPDDITRLNIGIELGGDTTKTTDLLQRLAKLVHDTVGITLVTQQTDNGAVIATNTETAKAFSADGGLSDVAGFKASVEHADKSLGGVFINIGEIVKTLQASNPPGDVAKVLNDLKEIAAFGASSWMESDTEAWFSAKLAFK